MGSVFLHLHIRILTTPQLPVDLMLDRMRSVYEPNDILIKELTRKPLDLPEAESFAVNISDEQLTEDQELLFGNRDGVGDRDICVYFVEEIKVIDGTQTQPLLGSSIRPPRKPAVVIARYAPEWTLAHEVGHVLGLAHDETDEHRLMYETGKPVPASLPYLVWKEMSTIFKNPVLLHAE